MFIEGLAKDYQVLGCVICQAWFAVYLQVTEDLFGAGLKFV